MAVQYAGISCITEHTKINPLITVPVKCKLTVSTRSSKLDSRVSNVETFEFRDARIEDREYRVSRIEKHRVLNMQTRKELRENDLFLEG